MILTNYKDILLNIIVYNTQKRLLPLVCLYMCMHIHTWSGHLKCGALSLSKKSTKQQTYRDQYHCPLTSYSNLDIHLHEKSNTLTVHFKGKESLSQYAKAELGYFEKVLQLPNKIISSMLYSLKCRNNKPFSISNKFPITHFFLVTAHISSGNFDLNLLTMTSHMVGIIIQTQSYEDQ